MVSSVATITVSVLDSGSNLCEDSGECKKQLKIYSLSIVNADSWVKFQSQWFMISK